MSLLGTEKKSFLNEVKEISGQQVELCFHCQKCSSGCIPFEYADYSPNQIIRLVQTGQKQRAINSLIVWLCSSCETCGARCPNDINIREVMDAIKEIAIENQVDRKNNIYLFHNTFLDTVYKYGRVHEPSLIMKYKLKSGDLFSDLGIGWEMFKKGKMPLLPTSLKNKKSLKNMFVNSNSIKTLKRDNNKRCRFSSSGSLSNAN